MARPVKLVTTLGPDKTEEPSDAVKGIWKVLTECDTVGKRHLEELGRADRKKKRNKQKKDKKKKDKKKKKGKKRSSSSDSSSSSSSSPSSSLSSSSSSSSSSSGGKKSKKSVSRPKTGFRGGASSNGPVFRTIDGKKHFQTREGNWVDCSRLPNTACCHCEGRHC